MLVINRGGAIEKASVHEPFMAAVAEEAGFSHL
jgi:hypothetical protein